MKIPKNHQTDIDFISNNYLDTKYFISSWDNSDRNLDFHKNIVENSIYNNIIQVYQNYFVSEIDETKEHISRTCFSKYDSKITSDYFSLTPNGTTSIFALLNLLHQNNKLKVLLLTPMYFSYIEILKNLNVDIHFIQIIKNGVKEFNIELIRETIKKFNINLVIATDPIFGTGQSLTNREYDMLVKECENYDSHIIIDYIYGGLEWYKEISIVNCNLINKVIDYSKLIIIDSISKNLSLNGVKSCILYASQQIIKEFEHFAIISIGSISSFQIGLLKDIYNYDNRELIIKALKKNRVIYKSNFDLINNLIENTALYQSHCCSGYYSLLGFPKKTIKSENDYSIMKDIFKKSEVLVIPHSRYLYYDTDYFLFRLNLSIEQPVLLQSINKLIQYYENSVKA